jgi:hypothetical protein
VETTHSEALNHKLFQLAMSGDTRALIHLQKRLAEDSELVVEAPLEALKTIDRCRVETDDRKRDRMMKTVMSTQSN